MSSSSEKKPEKTKSKKKISSTVKYKTITTPIRYNTTSSLPSTPTTSISTSTTTSDVPPPSEAPKRQWKSRHEALTRDGVIRRSECTTTGSSGDEDITLSKTTSDIAINRGTSSPIPLIKSPSENSIPKAADFPKIQDKFPRGSGNTVPSESPISSGTRLLKARHDAIARQNTDKERIDEEELSSSFNDVTEKGESGRHTGSASDSDSEEQEQQQQQQQQETITASPPAMLGFLTPIPERVRSQTLDRPKSPAPERPPPLKSSTPSGKGEQHRSLVLPSPSSSSSILQDKVGLSSSNESSSTTVTTPTGESQQQLGGGGEGDPLQKQSSINSSRASSIELSARYSKEVKRGSSFSPRESMISQFQVPHPQRVDIEPPSHLKEKGASKVTGTKTSTLIPEKEVVVATPELEKRRSLIVKELVSTEITYVGALRQLVEKYIKPIREFCEQNVKLVNNIDFIERTLPLFTSAETIKPLNESFVSALEKIVATWDNQTKLGSTFKTFFPFLKLYTEYSNNYDTALSAIEDASDLPWFETICSDRLELESCLITPVQRIPRYSLLLNDLWKHTPSDHPDEADLQEALATCKNVADHVNSAIARARNSELLTMLGLGHLLEPHRRLIQEGTIKIGLMRNYDTSTQKKVKRAYQFFLFNDLFVFMKVRKEFKAGKELGKNKSVRIDKTVKLKHVWDPQTDAAWPLELVWLRYLDEKSFEIIGPMKTLLVKTQEKSNWYHQILENVQVVLKTRDPNTPDDAAEKLNKRIGRYTFSSGEVYEGEWDLGRLHGKGIMEFQGTCYEGEFELNLKSGRGKMEYADGQVYEGEWRSGKPHGFGVSCNKAGDKYTGEWFYAKRHGQGEMVYWNGDRYKGEWKENIIEGTGLLKLNKLNVFYTGSFIGGKFHGKGTLTTFNGIYDGDFDNGRQTGEGRMEYSNSEIYEGQWKNGLRHGQGKMISQEGIFVGTWSRDLKEGKGRMDYCDGSVYEGYFSLGKRHGKGYWYQIDKSAAVAAYSGDWVYDIRDGTGELIFSTGDKYVGPFVAGQPHGTGKIFLANGTTFDAKFNNGTMDGKVDITNEKGDVIALAPDGQIFGEIEGVELLVPPFVPLLPY